MLLDVMVFDSKKRCFHLYTSLGKRKMLMPTTKFWGIIFTIVQLLRGYLCADPKWCSKPHSQEAKFVDFWLMAILKLRPKCVELCCMGHFGADHQQDLPLLDQHFGNWSNQLWCLRTSWLRVVKLLHVMMRLYLKIIEAK